MIHAFSIPLLPADATWLNISAGLCSWLFPVIISLYGFLFFWPRFTKQKRIENISANAKEALQVVTQLEAILFKCKFLSEHNAESLPATFSSQQLQIELWDNLNQLRNSLLLLRNDADFQQIPEITELIRWIEQLEKLLQRTPEMVTSVAVVNVFTELSPIRSSAGNAVINPLEKLRTILLSIYEYRNPRTHHIRTRIW